MKWWYLAAAATLGLVFAPAAQAQPAPATALDQIAHPELIPQVQWPYRTYHPDYPTFCKTCYGGGGCYTREGKGLCANGGCVTLSGGVGSCAIYPPGINTCRKCGILGRAFCYECKRLGCNQTGGDGCKTCWALFGHNRSCGECYTGGCGCDAIKHTSEMSFCDKIHAFRNRPLGGRTVMSGPWQYRYYAYGWKEGPMSYYGVCVGAYESYLAGHFDDRGPINLGPGGVGTMDAYFASLNGASLSTVAPAHGPSPYVDSLGPVIETPVQGPIDPANPPLNLDAPFQADPAIDDRSPAPPAEASRRRPAAFQSTSSDRSF
ncbi:MAG TPA: hypothetical protein VGE52_21595 [Pirellulales bacterium]